RRGARMLLTSTVFPEDYNMIGKVTFYKLFGSIAGLVLCALVTAQLAYAHPTTHKIISHQHSAKATTVALEELAATLNTECLARKDRHRFLSSPKISKALAELVGYYNASSSLQDDIDLAGPCPYCSCVIRGLSAHTIWCRTSLENSWCASFN